MRKEQIEGENSTADSYFESYVNEELEGRRYSALGPPRRSSYMAQRFDTVKHLGGHSGVNTYLVPIVSGVRRSMRPMEPIQYPIDPLQDDENEG